MRCLTSAPIACSSDTTTFAPVARVAKCGAWSSLMAMSAMLLASISPPASEVAPSGPARLKAITMPTIAAIATALASSQRAHIGGEGVAVEPALIAASVAVRHGRGLCLHSLWRLLPMKGRPMHVEIWSDIACPWCYIGKRRFESALAQFEHAGEVEVTWRSFELDPEAPLERHGDRAARLAEKDGITV